MKPIAPIEARAVSEAEIINRWDMATEREGRAERTLAETRLEKGRILVEARKMFPSTGRAAGGWGKLLSRLRTDGETARRYMLLAGYVEKAPHSEEVPTYAGAGITKRAPKVEPEAPRELAVHAPRGRVDEPMPDDERAALVEQLRRDKQERREAELAPLRMESRESAHATVLVTVENCIASINQMRAAGVDASACSTSPTEYERSKARWLTLYRMVVQELAHLGTEASVEPPAPSTKRQLTLVTGD